MTSVPDLARRAWLTGAVAALVTPSQAADRLDRFRNARAGRGAVDHAAFDRLLGQYVRVGGDGLNRVDYAAWKASAPELRALSAYVAALEAVDPAGLSRPEQFAFWVNLYNALTLRLVLERYPVRSIRAIRPNPVSIGPWKQPLTAVAGQRLSLDDIEHGILRRGWREPRVHYAVNCASVGCPNLRTRAFRGASLEAELTDAARDFVNHPRGARVVDGKLVTSSIYRWFREDFGGSDAGIIAHLTRHAAPPLRAALAQVRDVSRHEYDWSLNDTTRR